MLQNRIRINKNLYKCVKNINNHPLPGKRKHAQMQMNYTELIFLSRVIGKYFVESSKGKNAPLSTELGGRPFYICPIYIIKCEKNEFSNESLINSF